MGMESIGTPVLWVGFTLFVLALLGLDLVVFSAFAVPAKLQHRVLVWGILGALIMRAIFIVLGAALLQSFHWVIYVFGAFLIFTGIKLLLQRNGELHPERNPLFRLFRRFIPSVNDYREGHFTVVEGGKRYATPPWRHRCPARRVSRCFIPAEAN